MASTKIDRLFSDFSFPKDLPLTLVKVIGFAVVTALASKVQIFLPFSPVPITLQSFAVLLSGVILGARAGAASQIALIGLALLGFPVFAKPIPGFLVLLGPTGGYILGFIFAAYISGKIFEMKKPKSIVSMTFYFFISSFFIFVPGVIWLSVFLGKDLKTAIQIGLIPFLLGDVLKCFASAVLLRGKAAFK